MNADDGGRRRENFSQLSSKLPHYVVPLRFPTVQDAQRAPQLPATSGGDLTFFSSFAMNPSHGALYRSGEQKTNFQKTGNVDIDHVENHGAFVEKSEPCKRKRRGTGPAMLANQAQLPARTQFCLCFASIFFVFATLWTFGPDVGTALGTLAASRAYVQSLVPKAEEISTQDDGSVDAFDITPDVQFDNYTLFIKGQRVFIQYDTVPGHSIVARYNETLFNTVQENSTHSGCQSRRCGLTSFRRLKQPA